MCDQLHKTRDEIADMPNDEYVRWYVYFSRKAQHNQLRG